MATTLRQGSRGPEVTDLQRRLKAAGYDPGPIDGVFGSQTYSALRRYQSAKRLAVDGIAGPQTWASLGSGSGGAAKPTSSGGTTGHLSEGQIISKLLNGEFGAYIRPFLDVPEIRKLAINLAPTAWTGRDHQWTPDMFLAKVQETGWYRTHNQNQRDWLKTLSPADRTLGVRQTLDKMASDITDLWGDQAFKKQFGSLADFRHNQNGMATDIASGNRTYEGWLMNMTVRARHTPGTIAYAQEQERIRNAAQELKKPQEVAEELWKTAHGDFFLNVSKTDALKWANDILNGKSSYAETNDMFRRNASTLFPNYAKSIANGVLPSSLLSPTIGTVANELEIAPDSIMDNPKIRGEILSQAAGAKGAFTASDWVRYARQLPEWRKTEGANKMAGDLAQGLLQTFGGIR